MEKPQNLADQSIAQQEAFIHLKAQDTSNIIFTSHVLKRMKQRKIATPHVVEILRQGRMKRPAEPNIRNGSLECRLERYIAGREIGVVVAVDEENPNLIVVTAMEL